MDALVEEATRRSSVLWLRLGDHPARPVWHLWHEGSAYVVTGGDEQPLPGAAAASTAVVLVRSKDKQGDRLAEWPARLTAVLPGEPLWDEVVPLLHAKRLNAPDGEEQPARWARSSLVLRLTPAGQDG